MTVTAAYDVRDGGMDLYLDDVRQDVVTGTVLLTPVQGAGLLALGAGPAGASVNEVLPERVRSLRVFSGAMTVRQVHEEVYPSGAGA